MKSVYELVSNVYQKIDSGKLKLELAKFAELEIFAQFASDLDKTTRDRLASGQRIRELLKQSQSSTLKVEEQNYKFLGEFNML